MNHSPNAGQRKRLRSVLPAIRDKMDLHGKRGITPKSNAKLAWAYVYFFRTRGLCAGSSTHRTNILFSHGALMPLHFSGVLI
jgi:hypothetical protein